jgi:hypothetical protein
VGMALPQGKWYNMHGRGTQVDRCAGMPVSAGATGQSKSTQEAIHWLTGKEFEVQEVECRAMGAPACVWEINKTPKQ